MASEITPTDQVRAHYGKHLGLPIKEHTVHIPDFHFDIMTIPGAPYEEGKVVATVGLAKHIGQELLLACHSDQFHHELVTLLAVVGKEQAVSGARMIRGQVKGPAGPLVTWGTTEALYVRSPVCFGRDFEPLILADGSHVHFLWLVPIHVREAEWIAANDTEMWREGAVLRSKFLFEDLLLAQGPDLLDFSRPEMELEDSNVTGEKEI